MSIQDQRVIGGTGSALECPVQGRFSTGERAFPHPFTNRFTGLYTWAHQAVSDDTCPGQRFLLHVVFLYGPNVMSGRRCDARITLLPLNARPVIGRMWTAENRIDVESKWNWQRLS